MNELVDFHCHLDLYNNFEEIVSECERKAVFTLAVTTTPRAWPRNFELSKQTKYVRAALGLHPQLITNELPEIDAWEQYFDETRYIGEVGLDASPSYYRYFDNQLAVFERILAKCSQTGKKILSVHSVRCASKVLELIVKSNTHINNRIVLHWFTGSPLEARRAVEIGCYFSINVAMIQSENGRKVLSILPIDRILTETDGPFTRHGNNIQQPWDVLRCVEGLASFYHIEPNSMQRIIYENLSHLLRE